MELFNKNENMNIILEKILIRFVTQDSINDKLTKRIKELEANQKVIKAK